MYRMDGCWRDRYRYALDMGSFLCSTVQYFEWWRYQ